MLFAALIGPYFIDWDNYKATFEAEASRILGQPVKVGGKADARLLPYPSVTFENVLIGDREGQPMMTVDRVSADLELFPLLQGEIHVVSMAIEKPRATVTMDDSGSLDWLIAGADAGRIDPAAVTLAGVEISDGVLVYSDPSSGIRREFQIGHATVEAGSLAGPWRIEGIYSEGSGAGTFQLTTGRTSPAGLRAKVELTPPDQPVTYTADGTVTSGAAGLTYAGTFATEAVFPGLVIRGPVDAPEDAKGSGSVRGWRSEGSFVLTRKRLRVDKAVVSFGPEDQPASLAGSLDVALGENAKFSADLQARQLDIDHLLGGEPDKPVAVGEAGGKLLIALAGIKPPSIPGSVGFNVGAVVVGGGIIQDARFRAAAVDGGWQIGGLHARLPGQGSVDADGLIATGENLGFSGRATLKVPQPAAFSSWWRGRRDPAAALLPPFEIAGSVRIEPGRIAFSDMNATIGGANIGGAIAWSDANAAHPRLIETDLTANRLELTQIKSLAELLAGREIGDANAFADSYKIKLKADEVAIEDVLVRNVSIDAGYVDGTVSVKRIDIGDIGGAHLTATEGEIADAFADPRGRLIAHLDAATLNGLARLLDRLFPDNRVSSWLDSAAPALVPLIIDGSIEAPPRGFPDDKVRLKLSGSAGTTKVDASLDLTGKPSAWPSGATALQLELSSYNALNLLEQIGLTGRSLDRSGSASLRVAATGIPADGMPATVEGNLAGVVLHSAGRFSMPKGGIPGYSGDFEVASDDLAPLIQMAGVSVPVGAGTVPLSFKGKVDTAAGDVTIADSSVAGHAFHGAAKVGRGPDGVWQVDGDVALQDIDLPWLTSLGFGAPFVRSGDPAAPWSRAPFAAPPVSHIAGKIRFDAERLTVAPDFEIANPKVTLALAPDRVEIRVADGEIAGGSAEANLAIHNADGNVGFVGNFQLKDVALDRFIWQRAGRAIATGKLSLSANVEGTGRSPAGLVATLTGGGTVLVSEGELRYLNQRAASLVVRASDNGKLYDNDGLRADFAGYIDAGTFPFGSTGGAFSVAAGAVRLDNLTLSAGDTTITGGGTINLADLSLDSDWTLTLDPGDDEAAASGPPQVGLVFRGPVDAPERSIDVLPFASYLNVRQTERIQKQIEEEQAARLERDRFSRERRKLRDEALARVQAERDAAAARAALLRDLDLFHDAREIAADARAEAARQAVLAALKSAAEKAAAERAAAEAAAGDASAKLTLTRTDAEEARAAVVAAVAAETAASDTLAAAEAAVAEAAKAADDAAARAREALSEADAAEKALTDKQGEKAAADAAVIGAQSGKAAAIAAAKAAAEALAFADAARKKAEDAAAGAAAGLAAARTALGDAQAAAAAASSARDTAAGESGKAGEAARQAAEALAAARTEADRATAERDALRDAAAAARSKADADAAVVKAADKAVTDSGADADAARNEAGKAADNVGSSANAAKAAAARAAALKIAADQAAKDADDLDKAAIARRNAVGPAEDAAAEAKAAADAAAKARDEAVAAQQAAAAESDRAIAESEQKKQLAEAAAAALAAVRLKVDAAEKAAGEAAAKALDADAAARAANAAVGAAQTALNSGNGDQAALDAAARQQLSATLAMTAAREAHDAAAAGVEALKPELAAASSAAEEAQAAFDAALAAAVAAAKREDEARSRADAAAADAEAKAKLADEAGRAAEAARADAANAEKAAADAVVRKKAADEALAAAEAAVGQAAAEADKAVAARSAAEKVAADKAAASERATGDAAAPESAAAASSAAADAAEKASRDAEARAADKLAALAAAEKAKSAADTAVAAAADRLARAGTDLAARNAEADRLQQAVAAAEAKAKETADAAAAARSAAETAVARKRDADQAVIAANAALDAAQKAAKAIAGEPASAATLARKRRADATALQAAADAAADTLRKKSEAAAAAKAALADATAARAAAEKKAAESAAEVARLEKIAKDAAALAAAKAEAAQNATLASLQPPAVPLPPLRIDAAPIAEPPVGDVVMAPVTGPLPPLPPMRPAKKKPAPPAPPMVLAPVN